MSTADKRTVMVKAHIASAFVMVKTQLPFQLPIVEFYGPAQPGQTSEMLRLFLSREIGEPEVGRGLLVLGPFHDEPFVVRGQPVAGHEMGGYHSDQGKAARGRPRLPVGSGARKLLSGPNTQSLGETATT